MKARSSRALRAAARFGDLGGRQPEVMTKYEDRTLIRRQSAKAAFELVAIRDRKELVPRGRPVGW